MRVKNNIILSISDNLFLINKENFNIFIEKNLTNLYTYNMVFLVKNNFKQN